MQAIIAIVGGLMLVGFIWFAFRQGSKVTPDDRADRSGQTNYGGGGGDS
jgi:cbb3-type cytochrome oxidase subunit 3